MARYTKTGTPSTIGEVNAQFDLIATAIGDTLSRVGDAPNQLETTLDANSNRILNLPAPLNPSEPARLQDLSLTPVPLVDASVSASVSIMKVTDFAIGDYVVCQRYYLGGELIEDLAFEIQASQAVDGYGNHTLSNGNIAKLIGSKNLTVVHFGAVGDGVTINTNSIAATVAANSSIKFPDGVFISEAFTLSSNKHLVLTSGATIKAKEGFMTTGNGSMLIDIAAGVENVSITGGTIDGNLSAADLAAWPNSVGNSASPFTTTPYLVWVRAVDNVVFEGVNFINTISSAIRLFTPNQRVTVNNCYFDNILGNCIDGGVEQLTVTGNVVNLIGDIRGGSAAGTKGGLVVVNCKLATIANNNIRQTTDSTIYIVSQPGGNASVTGNVIKYSGKDAIKVLESSNNCVLSGNVVIAAGKSCIGVFDDGVTDAGHSIMANNIIGYIDVPTDILDPLAGYAVKTITGCTNQSVLWSTGATAFGSAAIGANASNLIITGNKLSNVEGVAINPTEQNVSITNNLFQNVTGVAIKQQSNSFIISNNLLQNIGYDPAKSFDGEVYGISLTGSNLRGTVSDNVLITVGGDGIFADSNLDVMNISGNTISSFGGSAAIYLNGAVSAGTSSRVNVVGNNLEGTGTTIRGIYARSIDSLNISNNVIDSASEGIRVDVSGDVVITANNVSNCSSDGIRVSGATLSAAVTSNVVDTATTGIKTDTAVLAVTAFGNIGRNCTTSYSLQAASSNIKPAAPADANL
jgi:hypothetical protein